MRLEQYDKALLLCNRSLNLKASYAPTYSIRAMVLEYKGSLDEARSDYDQAIRLQPENWGLFHSRGEFLERHGDDVGAKADLETVYRMSPDWVETRSPFSDAFARYSIGK
ncbi:MAG: Flp pilus assembly protein TadD [Parasphingorhabdus sp.]|jgi:Flp pilus assembly protein TadD